MRRGQWFASWAAGLSVAVAVAGPAAADNGYGHGPPMMWDRMWPAWFFGPGMMLLLALALIVVAVVFGRRGRRDRDETQVDRAAAGRDTALAILEERFARGEIDEAEFRRRRQVLAETHAERQAD